MSREERCSVAAVNALLDAAGLDPSYRSAEDLALTSSIQVLSSIDQLQAEYVLRNRPALLQGALTDWPPICKWCNDAYLREAGADCTVTARRVHARSGSCVESGAYETETISWPTLIDSLAEAQAQLGSSTSAPYYAAQLRLRTALPVLYADTRPEPACVRALGTIWRNAPSAYFGCGSRTPLHFDLLENIFCVVAGVKHVALWHPAHGELLYPGADGDASRSLADVFAPDLVRFPHLARAESEALHVDVRAGDALYIPLGWWHAVSTPARERSISVSFWAQQPEGKERTPEEELGGETDELEGDVIAPNDRRAPSREGLEFAIGR